MFWSKNRDIEKNILFSKLDFETTNYVDIFVMRWYNTTVT